MDMESKTYIPTIKRMKIVKSKKKIRGKEYIQGSITIPKEFLDKLLKENINEIISIVDDFFIGIPAEILLNKSKGEIISEFSDLLDWLKEHVKKIGDKNE